MAADVVDDAGQPVRDAVGELVIRKPWPGMTRGFWHDAGARTTTPTGSASPACGSTATSP